MVDEQTIREAMELLQQGEAGLGRLRVLSSGAVREAEKRLKEGVALPETPPVPPPVPEEVVVAVTALVPESMEPLVAPLPEPEPAPKPLLVEEPVKPTKKTRKAKK